MTQGLFVQIFLNQPDRERAENIGTRATKLLTVCLYDLQHLSRCCVILEQIQASVQIHFSLARIQLCVFFLHSFFVFCLLGFFFFFGGGGQRVQKWETSSCVLEGFLCTGHVAPLASKLRSQCRAQPVEAGCSQAGPSRAGAEQAAWCFHWGLPCWATWSEPPLSAVNPLNPMEEPIH